MDTRPGHELDKRSPLTWAVQLTRSRSSMSLCFDDYGWDTMCGDDQVILIYRWNKTLGQDQGHYWYNKKTWKPRLSNIQVSVSVNIQRSAVFQNTSRRSSCIGNIFFITILAKDHFITMFSSLTFEIIVHLIIRIATIKTQVVVYVA